MRRVLFASLLALGALSSQAVLADGDTGGKRPVFAKADGADRPMLQLADDTGGAKRPLMQLAEVDGTHRPWAQLAEVDGTHRPWFA